MLLEEKFKGTEKYLYNIEYDVHRTDLSVKWIPGHVVLAQELCVVGLRQLQVVLAALEHVDVLERGLVSPLKLELLSRDDAEDGPLVRHGLLLALRVVEDDLRSPDGVGLVLGEHVEVGVPLQVLVDQARVDPGGVLVERDIERFSNLVNLEEEEDGWMTFVLSLTWLTWRMEWMVMVILMMALVLLRGGGAINRLYEDSITSLLHPT